MTTVQFVMATALSLMVFVMLANFVVALYARGAIRAAVDEGARAGAPVDATNADCRRRGDDALNNLLGGAMRSGVHLDCVDDLGTVRARADVTLRGWLPLVAPDWSFSLTGTAVKEREP
jgi:hypothetical protein